MRLAGPASSCVTPHSVTPNLSPAQPHGLRLDDWDAAGMLLGCCGAEFGLLIFLLVWSRSLDRLDVNPQ